MTYPDGFVYQTHSKKPICGVLAVAICAGVSYDVAHAACKAHLGPGRRFGGKTFAYQRDAALRGLGVRFTEVEFARGLTVLEFALWADSNKPNKIFMIDIRLHILTLRQGCLIDQSQYIAWQAYQHKRTKVNRAIMIEGKGW